MKRAVVLLLAICLCLSIAACGKGQDTTEHICAGERWVVEKEASCTQEGLKNHVCSCGKVVATETIPLLSHSYEDGMCTGCLAEDPNYSPAPSQGLIYRDLKTGGCAVVSLGSCTDTYVVIGDTSPDGKPIEQIDDMAFEDRDSITKIYIGNNVTYIGERTFAECDNLTTVRLGNTLAIINYAAFINCKALEKINLPESLTYLGNHVFNSCVALTEITVPNSLYTVDVGTFQNCTALKRVVLGNAVCYINDRAFQGCTGLQELVIPKSLRRVEYEVFKGCSALEAIYVEDPFCYGSVSFMDQYANPLMFAGNLYVNNQLLTELVVPANMAPYARLQGCTTLTNVIFEDGASQIVVGAFTDCTNLKSVVIPESVTSIGRNAFKRCVSLESVVIPGAVTVIDDGAFTGCSKLASVTLPNGIQTIGKEAFYGCGAITQITIPQSVTTLGSYAFGNCTALKTVDMQAVGALKYDKQFYGCTALETINVPEDQLDNYLADAGWKELIKPDDQQPGGDGPSVSYSEGLQFKTNKDGTCEVLNIGTCKDTVIIIPATSPNGETVVKIANYAFAENSSITKVILPDTVKTIGIGAFQKCSALSQVVLSQSLETIEQYAFEYCSSLSSLDVPASLTTLGKSAFRGSYSLKTLTLRSETVLSCPYYTMNDPSNDPSLNVLYVPQSMVDAYKNAFNWATMSEKIQAIAE